MYKLRKNLCCRELNNKDNLIEIYMFMMTNDHREKQEKPVCFSLSYILVAAARALIM